MKKHFIVVALLVLITPSIALAAWWNPLSWFNSWKFNKIEVQKNTNTEVQQDEKSVDVSDEVKELKAQVEELKKQKSIKTAAPVPVISTPVIKSSNDSGMIEQSIEQARLDRIAEQERVEAEAKIRDKNNTLNSINKQIADLNAQYAEDTASITKNGAISSSQYDARVSELNRQYGIQYNKLKAEYQQVLYSE